ESQPPELSDFFFVDFEDGTVPGSWQVGDDWVIANGVITTERSDAEIIIPGLWGNFSLFARLRHQGQSVVQFRLREGEYGYYLIAIGDSAIRVFWQPTTEETEQIGEAGIELANNSYDLALNLNRNILDISVNESSVLKLYTITQVSNGSLRLIKFGGGTLALENLTVGPAFTGLDAATTASSPDSGTVPTPPGEDILLKLEISTGSDWTNLEILNSEIVRDARITATDGAFTNHTAAPDLIAMNQTLANAEAGKTLTLQVDLWIDANAKADKLDMILKKGDIGLATLRFYRQPDAGDVLIQEITHDFPEGGPTGLNALPFSIPLNKTP
ncbi:MAG: hypothetical protein MUO77_02355, partial [Anaerolineales bacterium]|nr:hypothetical protein [Anaerolineales bacterium]